MKESNGLYIKCELKYISKVICRMLIEHPLYGSSEYANTKFVEILMNIKILFMNRMVIILTKSLENVKK